jgi:FixJ family two-component response regulator
VSLDYGCGGSAAICSLMEDSQEMAEHLQSDEIFIVDDDPMVRDGLCGIFTRAGYRATGFIDGASFIEAARRRTPACIILDLYLPGRSGLEVLKDIDASNYPAPIFIASGRGDIPSAVTAIKSGAFDFFEKRRDAHTLLERVRNAVGAWERRRRGGKCEDLLSSFPGSELLTRREREVLAQIVASATNKEAASTLGISTRTVEIHRAHIMQKLGAKNSIDLTRKVLGRELHGF